LNRTIFNAPIAAENRSENPDSYESIGFCEVAKKFDVPFAELA